MLIDTHAHSQFNAFKGEEEEVVRRALEDDVWMINVGTQRNTSHDAVALADKFDHGVYAAVGLHPIHIMGEVEEAVAEGSELAFKARREDFEPKYYGDLVKKSKKVVAVGECGLDYYRLPVQHAVEAMERQKEGLKQQIAFASEMNLPVIFHCRDAHSDLQSILKQSLKDGLLPRRGVMHCFTSDYDDAIVYIEMGFMISFSGILTFSENLQKVARLLPLNKILVETDAPYLTPVPFRGKRNEPAHVKYTAQELARVRGISFEEAAAATTANAKRLFGI